MNDFGLWFTTGMQHITDPGGYDHILFVMLLVLTQPLNEWKKLLWLVTGFTIGHSVALALSVMDVVRMNTYYTEILIVLTILFTALYHICFYRRESPARREIVFFIIPLFGGIHGLGFSALLRSMLGDTDENAFPLLYFNIGLEAGQLLIVAAVLLFSLLLTRTFRCPFKYYKLAVSCFIALVSVYLLCQRF